MKARLSTRLAFGAMWLVLVAPTLSIASPQEDATGAPPPKASNAPAKIAPTPATSGSGDKARREQPAEKVDCDHRDDLLGVSRVVEINTTTGPRFGDQYRQRGETHFLQDHEVILTFDDGPIRRYTLPILEALEAQCTRATFFSVGRMAIADPATLREIVTRGNTLAIHTWSHARLPTLDDAGLRREVELGLSAVTKANGAPVAPFFRFPYLADNKAALNYVEGRGFGVFGIHVDSSDFRTKSPGTVVRNVMSQLAREKKGIILFHDIQPSTAGAVATMLAELKAAGFKVVHMIPKTGATTLPEFDAIAEKMLTAKEQSVAANPLAPRAATWPVSKGFANVANSKGTLPSTDKAPRAPSSKPAGAVTGTNGHDLHTNPLGQ